MSTTRIETKFSKLIGVNTPVVCAPMAGAAGGALAAQVALGGGFGFVAAGYDSVEKFRQELEAARGTLQVEKGAILPIGVGFLAWLLEQKIPEQVTEELLSIIFEYRVRAVWLSFGDKLGYWVDRIRKRNEDLDRDRRILIFIQVSSVEEARTAIEEWKADIIVAQGIEAGGHGASYAPPLQNLVPAILSITPPDGPSVLGAGGLTGGAHLAALLALGASGIVLGTRFLLSPESRYTKSQRNALLQADSSQSVRTMAFDQARNTLGWPKGIDGRGLRNTTVEEYERGEDLDGIRKKYAEAVQQDDPTRTVVWAGTGVGQMKQILPAKDIVLEIHEECLERLSSISKLAIQTTA